MDRFATYRDLTAREVRLNTAVAALEPVFASILHHRRGTIDVRRQSGAGRWSKSSTSGLYESRGPYQGVFSMLTKLTCSCSSSPSASPPPSLRGPSGFQTPRGRRARLVRADIR